MSKIPVAILEALEDWRIAHAFAANVVSKAIGPEEAEKITVHGTAMSKFRTLHRLLRKHNLDPEQLSFQKGEQMLYDAYLQSHRNGKRPRR